MDIEVTKDNVIIDKKSDKPHHEEYKITRCYFTFDEHIDSCQNKAAIFTILSENTSYTLDIIDGECDIPNQVLKHEYDTIKLGVVGYDIETVDDEEVLKERYSPAHDTFVVSPGSYVEGAITPEEITPSQYEIYSAKLQEGLDEVDDALTEINQVLTDVNQAITETNNLNLDVSKEGKVATITLTKKDATTKTVTLSDGISLMYNWNGTELGIKREDEQNYDYADLKGERGDCYFATFSIVEGHLIMNKPEELSQINFRLNPNNGHLEVEVGI